MDKHGDLHDANLPRHGLDNLARPLQGSATYSLQGEGGLAARLNAYVDAVYQAVGEMGAEEVADAIDHLRLNEVLRKVVGQGKAGEGE